MVSSFYDTALEWLPVRLFYTTVIVDGVVLLGALGYSLFRVWIKRRKKGKKRG